MSLLDFEQKLSKLRMNTREDGEKSPHKVAMLLSVMDLIEKSIIKNNTIYFDENLKNSFSFHFKSVASVKDRDNPHLPFFHLRSSGFWKLIPKPGKEESYSKLTTATSPGVINSNILFAKLDDELFEYFENKVSREFLKSALMENITSLDRRSILYLDNKEWDWLECEALVKDYFEMLFLELSGVSYNKSKFRRELLPKLNNRSEGSIEFKHQNVSAIMLELGQPYINGYKPALNYQNQLQKVVLSYLAGHQNTLDELSESATMPVDTVMQISDWKSVFDPNLPERIIKIKEAKQQYIARRINYSERESFNRSLGDSGEQFILEFERNRLAELGRPDLSKEVVWSSKEQGDGLGYDIRSFSLDKNQENQLFIEVKTTYRGKFFPFYISSNELAFSRKAQSQYALYRVYNFNNDTKFFRLDGAVDQHVNLSAKNYLASF